MQNMYIRSHDWFLVFGEEVGRGPLGINIVYTYKHPKVGTSIFLQQQQRQDFHISLYKSKEGPGKRDISVHTCDNTTNRFLSQSTDLSHHQRPHHLPPRKHASTSRQPGQRIRPAQTPHARTPLPARTLRSQGSITSDPNPHARILFSFRVAAHGLVKDNVGL